MKMQPEQMAVDSFRSRSRSTPAATIRDSHAVTANLPKSDTIIGQIVNDPTEPSGTPST